VNRFGFVLSVLIGMAFIPGAQAQFPDAAGYTPLFNGRDLSGWTEQWKGDWSVQKGVLTGKQDPAVGQDSWLFTNSEWDDFSLYVEFKMTPDCNSGVGIRMPQGVEGRPSQYGYEIQIADSDNEFPTGSVFRHVAANQKLHRAGWNEMFIVTHGDHIVVYLNRQKVVDTRLEGSKKGRVGLQVHGGETYRGQVVEFRTVKIKDLKPQYQAAPSTLQFKIHQLDGGLSEGCSVTDVNRDGKLDITCGSYWYEAPAWTQHKLREVAIEGEYASNYGEYAMDVNRDGWPDIVSGGWFTPIMSWFEHPGGDHLDQLWKQHVIADDLGSTEGILLRDVDYDGRPDILVNRYDDTQPVAYFAYVGLEKSESGFERRILGAEGRGHGAGIGDINGDGRDDVLTPGGWYEAPQRPATQAWTFHGNFKAPHSGIPLLVEDFNNDGLADIVWGHAHDFGLFWLEQTRDSAGRQAWIEHTIDSTFSQVHCPILVDLDGDGTQDIIAGKRYRGHNGADPGAMEPLCIFWYKVVKGADPQFIKHIVTYDDNVGVGMNTQVVDVDNDGDLDLVAPGKTGIHFIENLSR